VQSARVPCDVEDRRTGSGDARGIGGFAEREWAPLERSGIEAKGPIVGAGSAGKAAAVDGDLHGMMLTESEAVPETLMVRRRWHASGSSDGVGTGEATLI